VVDDKIQGSLKPTGVRPTFMPTFKLRGIELPPGEYGIPPQDPDEPILAGKSRWGLGGSGKAVARVSAELARGRAVQAGGMVYISSIGPVDPETKQVVGTEIKTQARQCLTNLKARLEESGSSLDEVVWANWSLRENSEFDPFYEEWLRWFPNEAPVGQGTLMPMSHRRAGFRVSIGVIASTQVAPSDPARPPVAIPVERPEEAQLSAPVPEERAATS
jgi:enamine deaminase RidA (YjgF/YER057c/UK114 family)